jgi:hypothetical protein
MDAGGWAAHQPETSNRDVEISVSLKRIASALLVDEFLAAEHSIP